MSNQPENLPNQPPTTGGIHVGGDWVQGDKVAGDKIVTTVTNSQNVVAGKDNRQSISSGLAGAELSTLFAPILAALSNVPAGQRPAATQAAQELLAEASKGAAADDTRLGKLLDQLTGLVPGAVSAVVSAFASPLLAAVAGPVTKFVLEKLQKK